MHTRTSMSTSANCSHSRNLINSIFVVCTVVSSSDRLHIIAFALSVSSPRLPSVVWYRETDLQCCSSSLTLGRLEAHKLWLLFPSQKLPFTNEISTQFSTDFPTVCDLQDPAQQYPHDRSYIRRETPELPWE